MSHAHHTAFESFWVSAALIMVALVYLGGWLHVRSVERVQGWRTVSFLLGLLLIWIVLASPLGLLDHESLTAHMVQHLLLMTVAPPLVFLGAPVKLLMNGLPHRLLEVIDRLFRPAPVKQLVGT